MYHGSPSRTCREEQRQQGDLSLALTAFALRIAGCSERHEQPRSYDSIHVFFNYNNR
jgi:hypothetical protein